MEKNLQNNLFKKQIFFKKVKKRIKKKKYLSYKIIYNIFKMIFRQDKKQVLFLSNYKNELIGNLKFVYKELEKNKEYKLKCFLKIGLVENYTLKEKIKLCHLLVKSKYILIDDYNFLLYHIKLRENTKLVQLWHATGAFKKFGHSVLDSPELSINHKSYTDVIVSSENIRKNYAEAFAISIDKIHATGIPRTDIFFDKNYEKKVKKRIYNKYSELKNKKVIMFAPTFRGEGNKKYYNFKWLDFKMLQKKLSKDYVFIIKMHPAIKNINEMKLPNSDFFINLSDEKEINDLLFITDILITDYSSVIFEYSFFERSVIFYLPDLDKYKKTRDMYYPLEKYLYGEVALNMEELIDKIKKEKVDKQKIKKFKDYFCSACDGNSTKNVIKKIMQD